MALRDIGLKDYLFKVLRSAKGEYCFISIEMAKVIREQKSFSSEKDLVQKLIDPLNEELNGNSLDLKRRTKYLTITCGHTHCPFKLTYSITKNARGEINSIVLAEQTQVKFHAVKAHQ